MTNYSIQTQEMGKVINLMSSDFSKLELFFIYIFKIFVAPFAFTAVVIVLLITFGWTAVIILALLIFTALAQFLLTKIMGRVMKSINQLRDERVKKLSAIIAGIKALKMYSWESYFKEESEEIKKAEKKYYNLYFLGLSFSRSVAFTSTICSSIIFFIFTYYVGDRSTITAANMVSFLQIFVLIKVTMRYCSLGL